MGRVYDGTIGRALRPVARELDVRRSTVAWGELANIEGGPRARYRPEPGRRRELPTPHDPTTRPTLPPMIIERGSHPQFVSNTYLVADGAGGPGLFVDAGGPVPPLIAAAQEH